MPIAGRTHLQHAVPTTFGLKCAIWASPFVTHLERLDQAAPRILVVQFGGAAGTLAALGAMDPRWSKRSRTNSRSAFRTLPWHAQRDRFAETAALLGLICGSLSKFALDMTLMMQTEVGEVSEPHEEGRGGSSTMPQKRNPIASEYILGGDSRSACVGAGDAWLDDRGSRARDRTVAKRVARAAAMRRADRRRIGPRSFDCGRNDGRH